MRRVESRLRRECGCLAGVDEAGRGPLAGPVVAAAVVLDAETVAFIDVTASDMLATLTGELAATGVELIVAHDVGQVRDTLRETGAEDSIGHRAYRTVDEAIEALSRERPPGAPAA